jgi:hypothetical protein
VSALAFYPSLKRLLVLYLAEDLVSLPLWMGYKFYPRPIPLQIYVTEYSYPSIYAFWDRTNILANTSTIFCS